MNQNINPSLQQRKQVIFVIWLVFLISTISLPIAVYVGLMNKDFDPSLESGFASFLMLLIGLILLIFSHIVFKKISAKPIDLVKYQVQFTLSCVLSEAITIVGILHGSTSNFDKFSLILFVLGFLALIIKKPNLDFVILNGN